MGVMEMVWAGKPFLGGVRFGVMGFGAGMQVFPGVFERERTTAIWIVLFHGLAGSTASTNSGQAGSPQGRSAGVGRAPPSIGIGTRMAWEKDLPSTSVNPPARGRCGGPSGSRRHCPRCRGTASAGSFFSRHPFS